VGCDGFLEGAASWHHDSVFTKRLQSEIGLRSNGLIGMDSIKRGNRSMHFDRTLDRTRTVANENNSWPLRLRLIYISCIA
jgi:hypothetical protein